MTEPGRTISSLFALRLIRAAAQAGLEVGPLWKIVGGEVREDTLWSIPEASHLALWAHIMRALDDPGFPIAYARTMSIDDYGVLGLACKTADTMGAALAIVERYLPAYADVVAVKLVGSALVLERPGAPDLGHRSAVESTLAEILGSMRQLVPDAIVPSAVTFAHAAPRSFATHVEHFGVAPQFAAPRHALELTPEILASPITRADVALHRYLVGELDRLLAAQRARSVTWTERTRSEILRRLPMPIEIADVARAFATSQRTLQRRLETEGTRFDEIADTARRELATALLEDRSRTISEVAFACGFAEPSSFTRAYRRWTGRAPRDDR